MNLSDSIQSYLNKTSYTLRNIETGISKKFKNIIVIPACAESENIPRVIRSLSENESSAFDKTLALFVINNSENADVRIKEDNLKSISYLRKIIDGQKTDKKNTLTFGLIDAASLGNELPEKSAGVGLARKTGMDAALTLFDTDHSGKNILICLDADCTVSDNYISGIEHAFNNSNLSAASIDFEHIIDKAGKNTEAIICYEIFLRYYVLGLKYAESPYAFHTVGSAMACDAESYIAIEGMNTRKAAEDFYFLEKLAKSVKVSEINSVKVFPASRKSWRVPFGTGQRVNRFHAGTHNEFLLYDPASFDILKAWLRIFLSDSTLSAAEYMEAADLLNSELYRFLEIQKFEKSLTGILDHSKTRTQLELQKRRWFDGFRTLKLIHHLRDTAFPAIDMFDALDSLFDRMNIKFKSGRIKGVLPDKEIQISYLTELRKQGCKTEQADLK